MDVKVYQGFKLLKIVCVSIYYSLNLHFFIQTPKLLQTTLYQGSQIVPHCRDDRIKLCSRNDHGGYASNACHTHIPVLDELCRFYGRRYGGMGRKVRYRKRKSREEDKRCAYRTKLASKSREA
jgi:hypothetical protein